MKMLVTMMAIPPQDGDYSMVSAKSIALPMEGLWIGRPFRGMHQKYLTVYVAMFEWAALRNLKRVTPDFLRT
jgi:hypothetical protein